MYRLEFTEQALRDVLKLQKSEQQAYKKLAKLLQELEKHPTTGTGQPEKLKHSYSGLWSRRITQKHRLVYKIEEEKITVVILLAYGHYED